MGGTPSLRRGIYSREAVRAEHGQLNRLACIHKSQVVVVHEEVYVAQLFGTNPSDFNGQEYLEEVVMVQMEIIFQLRPMVCICFFRHMGCTQFQVGRPMALLWLLSDAGPYFGGFASNG